MVRPVAVIFHRYGPYHVARLRAAGQRGPVLGIELSGQDHEYAWDPIAGADGFSRLTLAGDADAIPIRELLIRLTAALDAHSPSTVFVNGWAGAVPAAALRWCQRRGVPAAVMSESTSVDRPRRLIREAVKRRVVRCFAAALIGGRRQAEYAIELGVPVQRVFTGYNAVDNDHFLAGADAARAAGPDLRRRLGLPEHYFLASSRFVPQKNLPGLLAAFAAYRATAGDDPWGLVLLGDGPLKADLQRETTRLALTGAIKMPGFIQYPDLPAYYGLAGAFVHASTSEPWGLVVNEAMAAGLPVIVSDRCGCAPDLVLPGETGFSFDPADGDGLARLLVRASTRADEREALGRAARARVGLYGVEAFAAGFWAAAAAAQEVPRVRPGVASRLALYALGTR